MNWHTIFKRVKPVKQVTHINYELSNWQQEAFERNLKEGVVALQSGKPIRIYDDGRGYELAIRIKDQYILEYQKRLAEKIHIEKTGGVITIQFKIEEEEDNNE